VQIRAPVHEQPGEAAIKTNPALVKVLPEQMYVSAFSDSFNKPSKNRFRVAIHPPIPSSSTVISKSTEQPPHVPPREPFQLQLAVSLVSVSVVPVRQEQPPTSLISRVSTGVGVQEQQAGGLSQQTG